MSHEEYQEWAKKTKVTTLKEKNKQLFNCKCENPTKECGMWIKESDVLEAVQKIKKRFCFCFKEGLEAWEYETGEKLKICKACSDIDEVFGE